MQDTCHEPTPKTSGKHRSGQPPLLGWSRRRWTEIPPGTPKRRPPPSLRQPLRRQPETPLGEDPARDAALPAMPVCSFAEAAADADAARPAGVVHRLEPPEEETVPTTCRSTGATGHERPAAPQPPSLKEPHAQKRRKERKPSFSVFTCEGV